MFFNSAETLFSIVRSLLRTDQSEHVLDNFTPHQSISATGRYSYRSSVASILRHPVYSIIVYIYFMFSKCSWSLELISQQLFSYPVSSLLFSFSSIMCFQIFLSCTSVMFAFSFPLSLFSLPVFLLLHVSGWYSYWYTRMYWECSLVQWAFDS